MRDPNSRYHRARVAWVVLAGLTISSGFLACSGFSGADVNVDDDSGVSKDVATDDEKETDSPVPSLPRFGQPTTVPVTVGSGVIGNGHDLFYSEQGTSSPGVYRLSTSTKTPATPTLFAHGDAPYAMAFDGLGSLYFTDISAKLVARARSSPYPETVATSTTGALTAIGIARKAPTPAVFYEDDDDLGSSGVRIVQGGDAGKADSPLMVGAQALVIASSEDDFVVWAEKGPSNQVVRASSTTRQTHVQAKFSDLRSLVIAAGHLYAGSAEGLFEVGTDAEGPPPVESIGSFGLVVGLAARGRVVFFITDKALLGAFLVDAPKDVVTLQLEKPPVTLGANILAANDDCVAYLVSGGGQLEVLCDL